MRQRSFYTNTLEMPSSGVSWSPTQCLRAFQPYGDPDMKEQRARQILQALIQGVDPKSGEELPSGTIIQQADVLRALLIGVAAVMSMVFHVGPFE